MRVRLSKCTTISSLVLSAFLAASVSAAQVTLSNSLVGTNGGLFRATVTSGQVGIYNQNDQFDTFCLEVQEDFSPGTPYYVVASDQSVFSTGSSKLVNAPNQYGSIGYVPLDPEVAYLYSNYMAGTMTSVISSWTGSTNDLQAMQNEIWNLMGYTYTTGHVWSLTELTSINTAYSNSGWSGLGNVRVMQMWTSDTLHDTAHSSQDQLVLVPTPTASMAGLSLLGGLGIIGWLKRRNKAGVV